MVHRGLQRCVAAGLLLSCAAALQAASFSVTTTADNGNNASPTPGSLRWAIVHADAATGSASIIFNLSSCPALLSLTSNALPDITNDVTIDGYTQNGSTPNAFTIGFNATLCIFLNGGGSFPWAFHTSGGGRVTLRGFGLAGFTDAAIRLDAGDGNLIYGNQIGGIPFTAQNNDGIRISGTAKNSHVGYFTDPAANDLIIGNTGTGVYIDGASGGNTVASSLIGVGADAKTGDGNNLGIYVFDSSGNVIEYNIVSANTTQGMILAGPTTTGTLVQGNYIGETYNGPHASNGTQGVQVTFGAHDNTIGADTPGNGGNTIYALADADVWITPSAGTGNAVLANWEMYSGVALPVDLGAPGPTSNDAGDSDTGPNNLQNYPTILNAYRADVGAEWAEGVIDSTPNTNFRIDVYWAPCCSARGNATYYAGGGASGVTNASGHGHFWIKLPLVAYPSVGGLGATATSASGDTSETGVPAPEVLGEMIFRDDFE